MKTGTLSSKDVKLKLVLALQQVQNLVSLLEGNEYQSFIYSHLISIECELKRQLSNISK